jgi:hypothetical protein
VLITKYYSGNKIEKHEMGGVCSTYGSKRGAYRMLDGRLEGKNHLEELGINGSIISKLNFKKWNRWSWTGLSWLKKWTLCGRV